LEKAVEGRRRGELSRRYGFAGRLDRAEKKVLDLKIVD
jgi:hypothetical protein